MIVGPCGIRGDLVCGDPATERVEVGEDHIVEFLDGALELTRGDVFSVVELRLTCNYISHHVIAD